MASLHIDERKMVEENTFKYEEKIKSPSSRFLDTTQTYVNYFHIDNDNTTVDAGFKDVASLIGHRSPIRFHKIENFPIYGIEQIVLQLQDSDQGLDTNYEGEATILPNTIKPVPNDYFVIPTLNTPYIFRVTEIQYDNIMPDNFYKISFMLDFIDDTNLHNLENQVSENYICSLENIGTEQNCIIEKSVFEKIRQIESMYHNIKDFYMAMFYSERHNVFLGEIGFNQYLYDPYQTIFINSHNLFNEKNDLMTLILTNEVEDPKEKIKYAKSVYKLLEVRDMSLLNEFKYMTRPGITYHESSFYRWYDKTVQVLDIPNIITDSAKSIFSPEFKTAVEINADVDSDYATLIKKFIRKDKLDLKDIPNTLADELLYLNNNLEVFFFTPIIMYVIREIINEKLYVKK